MFKNAKSEFIQHFLEKKNMPVRADILGSLNTVRECVTEYRKKRTTDSAS